MIGRSLSDADSVALGGFCILDGRARRWSHFEFVGDRVFVANRFGVVCLGTDHRCISVSKLRIQHPDYSTWLRHRSGNTSHTTIAATEQWRGVSQKLPVNDLTDLLPSSVLPGRKSENALGSRPTYLGETPDVADRRPDEDARHRNRVRGAGARQRARRAGQVDHQSRHRPARFPDPRAHRRGRPQGAWPTAITATPRRTASCRCARRSAADL